MESPPMGWNSFDSYGVYLHENAAFENIKVLNEKYKPFGCEYFIIDNGWFGEYKLQPGAKYSQERHASDIHINEYGLVQPSTCYFPNGFQKLIDTCHLMGLKFGVHLMRGIPRKAVELNLPIQNTPYFARDIADTINVCSWCRYNYGVDMNKPGSQEFYNSLINQFASWGVDFIKADDIVPYPQEIEALAKAIRQCGRDIKLSLSPGDITSPEHIDAYSQAEMLRITADIWDTSYDIDKSFSALHKWSKGEQPPFWIDMDMIPFGHLQLMSPKTIDKKEIAKDVLYAGRGFSRESELTENQKLTFITIRALAASPLMIGGDLPTMDDFSYQLLTNKEMIKCNQNGVIGRNIINQDKVEVWKTPQKDSDKGWLGVFNRSKEDQICKIKIAELQIKDHPLLWDIWNKKEIEVTKGYVQLMIPKEGVIFIRYE